MEVSWVIYYHRYYKAFYSLFFSAKERKGVSGHLKHNLIGKGCYLQTQENKSEGFLP